MAVFLVRVVINAIGIAVTAWILPGIDVVNNDLGTLLIIGLIFGIVNAILKPILLFLTCPAVIVTLGLFILVINGLLLQVTAALVPDRLQIDNFGWAVVGGIVMSIIGLILEGVFGLRERRGKREARTIEYRKL